MSSLILAASDGGMTIAGKVIVFFFLPLFGLGGPLGAAAIWKIMRNTRQMAEDWRGEPARPGVAARPGVMERLLSLDTGQSELRSEQVIIREQLEVVHHEVRPNGGASIKDQLTRLDESDASRRAGGGSGSG